MDWNSIITFFVSAGAITVAIVYIGKRIVDKSLDIAVEKYKGALALELETHKKQLDKILIEHQIKFGKLHQDRLDVIKLFNTKLIDIQIALEEFISFWQGPEHLYDTKKEEKARMELDKLTVLLEINQIYFNQNLCNKLKDIATKGNKFVRKMVLLKREGLTYKEILEKDRMTPIAEDQTHTEKWLALEIEVNEKITEARAEMTNEFRKLIGVD